jgi:cytochrome c oxidase cbb3-type subunit 3
MRSKTILAAGVVLWFMSIGVAPASQQRGGLTSFPAQQRPPGDPALIERGRLLYGIHCRSCHGVDLRGGEQGGSNLLRSAAVLNDQAGERIWPVIRDGRQSPGSPAMPALALTPDEGRAIAEYLHSVLATARGQGAPPPGPPVELNVLVGDANAGRAYFESNCAACHSAASLGAIGARFPNPVQLQTFWVAGGERGGAAQRVFATVVLPSGGKVEGRLVRIDDFIVILNLADGTTRSFRRDGDVPKVEVRDPREPHRQLWPTYTDKDIHDMTAYLATLK